MGAAVLIALSVVLQAAAEAFLSGRISSGDSLRFSLAAFLGCTVMFLLGSRRRGTRRAGAGRQLLRPFALMNVASAVTFLGLYVSLVWVPASLAASLMAGAGPLASAVIASVQGQKPSRGTWCRSAVLLLVALGAAVGVQPSVTDPGAWQSGPLLTMLGASLAVLSGTGAAVIAHLSGQFGAAGVAPGTVMAHRFHLTNVLALGALLTPGLTEPPRLGVAVTVCVALAGVAVPLYILQIGVQRTPAMVTMVLLTVHPGLTYLVQGALGYPLTVTGAAAVSSLIAVAVVFAVTEQRAEKSRREALVPAEAEVRHPEGARYGGAGA